ncbi:MAG: hypothetical protein ACE5EG_08285, partial [Thermoanaerobaculia bacterium]
MASEQIDLTESGRLLLAKWRLISGLAALFGLAVLAAVLTLEPVVYVATARVTVRPGVIGVPHSNEAFWLYRPLLDSASILERTSARLSRDGLLPEGYTLEPKRDVSSREERPTQGRLFGSVVALTARSPDPHRAAAIANTWAQVFVEESLAMRPPTPADGETVLDERLAPTHQLIRKMESEGRRLSTLLTELHATPVTETGAAPTTRGARAGERQAALVELDRSIGRLAALETRLSEELEAVRLARMTAPPDRISIAVPAVPGRRPASRRIPVKVGLAMILGALLGVTVAFFRSAS